MKESIRHDRQERIKGWDQYKLSKATVVIIGNDCLAEFVLIGLTALGIGKIRIIANGKINDAGSNMNGFIKNLISVNKKKAINKSTLLAYVANKIDPAVVVIDINSTIVNQASTIFFGKPDIIIDVTNNVISKTATLNYSLANHIPFISGSADNYRGLINVMAEQSELDLFKQYWGQLQDLIVSEILGGFILDEVRKILMPFEKESILDKPLNINLDGGDRFGK